jgi:hypothetical protein
MKTIEQMTQPELADYFHGENIKASQRLREEVAGSLASGSELTPERRDYLLSLVSEPPASEPEYSARFREHADDRPMRNAERFFGKAGHSCLLEDSEASEPVDRFFGDTPLAHEDATTYSPEFSRDRLREQLEAAISDEAYSRFFGGAQTGHVHEEAVVSNADEVRFFGVGT